MAANPNTLISVEEYVNSSFEVDMDYVDGALEERYLGEAKHGFLQGELYGVIRSWAKGKGHRVVTEMRVQVAPDRFRIADVCVLRGNDFPRYATVPPQVCIEILSPEDRLNRIANRLHDYAAMGVPHVWVVDPQERVAWIYKDEKFELSRDNHLRAPELTLDVDLNPIFAELQEA